MRTWLVCMGVASALFLAPHLALAQSTARIFDVELGMPVSDLPTDQWVNPACGTNGGPPSVELPTFADYERCPVERETGLREVWFIYDNEWEYVARAYGDPVEIGRYSANVFYRQPVITSLMIDDLGRVQGYRVITDPRSPTELRMEAHDLLVVFKALFNGPWQCEDLPPGEGEEPFNGMFVKSRCIMRSDQRFMRIEAHLLRKPGQAYYANPQEGYFEGFTRLEVYSEAAISGQACCLASLPR